VKSMCHSRVYIYFVCVARFIFKPQFSDSCSYIFLSGEQAESLYGFGRVFLVFVDTGVSVLYGEILSSYGLVQTGLKVVAQTGSESVCMNECVLGP